jgi:hypothetical protein
MSAGAFRSLWQFAFQASPIILAGGIAQTIPGGLLPIVAITEALDIAGGILTGDLPGSLDEFFAQYLPMPNSTLIAQEIGEYPFANQAVAANAVIKQPLSVSMLMIAPVRNTGGYLLKLPTFTALQATFDQHNSSGGLYHIATPAFVYTNCLMTGMTDVSDGESRQPQIKYQLDFRQPLVNQQQLSSTLNSFMTRMTNGNQVTGNPTWSGPQSAIGTSSQGVPALSGTTNITGAVQQYQQASGVT